MKCGSEISQSLRVSGLALKGGEEAFFRLVQFTEKSISLAQIAMKRRVIGITIDCSLDELTRSLVLAFL